MSERYPMSKRLEILTYMEARQVGAYTAAKVFGCSESAIHRWKRTRREWEPRARLQASIRVLQGGNDEHPNEHPLPTVEITTALQLRRIIARNLEYLDTDKSLGSSSHYKATQVISMLAREFPQLLATTQADLGTLIHGEPMSETESEADQWLSTQLRVLAGGVTGEAK